MDPTLSLIPTRALDLKDDEEDEVGERFSRLCNKSDSTANQSLLARVIQHKLSPAKGEGIRVAAPGGVVRWTHVSMALATCPIIR